MRKLFDTCLVVDRGMGDCFNAPMDIYEIRRQNLTDLINKKYEGKVSHLARALGKKDSILNRIFSKKEEHRRNVGAELAREIEQVSSLVAGWMDVPHGEELPQLSPEAHKTALILSSLTDAQKDQVRKLLEAVGIELSIPASEIAATTQTPPNAILVTDPTEQVIIETYRAAGDIEKAFITNTINSARTLLHLPVIKETSKKKNSG